MVLSECFSLSLGFTIPHKLLHVFRLEILAEPKKMRAVAPAMTARLISV
jgi:hypothetical protein